MPANFSQQDQCQNPVLALSKAITMRLFRATAWNPYSERPCMVGCSKTSRVSTKPASPLHRHD